MVHQRAFIMEDCSLSHEEGVCNRSARSPEIWVSPVATCVGGVNNMEREENRRLSAVVMFLHRKKKCGV
jgi:hypothetical protein